jgi:hypothetical protein
VSGANETTWTVGPWRRDANDDIRAGKYDETIVIVDVVDRAERRATASLVAAAPDLYRELAHLVALMEVPEKAGGLTVPGLATLNGARAALAKARGETP